MLSESLVGFCRAQACKRSRCTHSQQNAAGWTAQVVEREELRCWTELIVWLAFMQVVEMCVYAECTSIEGEV